MDTNRVLNVRRLLNKSSLDACLITSVPMITYLTGFSNFSIEEREAFLLITKKNQYILTDGRYTTAVKNEVANFSLQEISSSNPLKVVLEKLIEKHKVKIIGIEEHNMHVNEFKMLKQFVKTTKDFPAVSLRTKKETTEIRLIEQACRLGDETFAFIIKNIKPGVTEKEIAYLLENFMRQNGSEPSFSSIVAFGENAAVPHHQTGSTKLGKNGLVLLDFGVKYHNYCSDMTRTIFLGKATAEQKKAYQTVYAAQQKSIEFLNSQLSPIKSGSRMATTIGTTLNSSQSKLIQTSDVDKAARDYIISQGYPSIPHSLGHGIGLEVHELPTLSPVSKQRLENDMVFSIEPGIYIPGKFGIRIEDLFVIENDKLRQLTHSPSHLIEL